MTKKSIEKKPKNKTKLIALVVVAVIIAAVFKLGGSEKQDAVMEFQKGMGYVTWSKDGYLSESSDKSLVKLSETGADWVSVLVTWYQTNPWSGDIHRAAKTPSDESVVHAIRKAHELGMKVMLKLHLDLLDTSDGSWRGEIGGTTEEGWNKWFSGYEKYMKYYTDMAAEENVEMICVGTELSTAATVKGYLWSDLIANIRKNYSGLLVYAAHWDSYMDIRFWDQLDYVGINAYFPLTETIVPAYDELKGSWGKWVAQMEEFQKRVQKPIIFPEAGCSSADGSATRPWEHIARTEVNLKLQEDFYRALIETFWEKDWFHGFYWWCWGTNVNMGGKYNRGFTPQNKPAEQVLKDWYAKPIARKWHPEKIDKQ